jgi:hypothetical protein
MGRMAQRVLGEEHVVLLGALKHREHSSEHPTKLEEPFVVAGVAYASPYK